MVPGKGPLGERILVTGGTGVIGPALISALNARHYDVIALSRRPAVGDNQLQGDLEDPGSYELSGEVHTAVHAGPIWLLDRNLQRWQQAGLSRLVAFSSSSGETKAESPSIRERQLAETLLTSERRCREFCEQYGIALTIFCPTMIYGYGRDQNVSRIANWIRRYRFFPIAGQGTGRRQPVHVDDLVAACLSAIDRDATYGRKYFLSGGETLSYREMIERIFAGVGLRARIARVPVILYRNVLELLLRLRIAKDLDPAMADRMEQDLCFDHSEAATDFGYNPGPFLDNPVRDLPVTA